MSDPGLSLLFILIRVVRLRTNRSSPNKSVDNWSYELFIVVIFLSVFRVDLHGLLDEVDGFARSRGGVVLIAERAAAGLVLLETREVLQRELEQIRRLVPQDLHGLLMMSAFPSSSSKSLTSTPLKSRASVPRRSRSADSAEDSTSSLLSPIYHDSFELSDEDPESDQPHPVHNITVTLGEDLAPGSLSRDEVEGSFKLSAWEQWIVDKAKEERVRKQQKAMEELMLKEKEEEQKKEQQKKKVVCDCKIQEWLQLKREQEKKERESKEFQKSKEQLQEEKRRAEIEKKAQEKYKEWLRKKKQEETERKLREKEEAARREAEERERKEKAEESFKEWLDGVKTKGKLSRQSSASSAGHYNNVNYPAPSFINPVPWKPIPVPQQDRTPRKSSARKRTPGPSKSQSSPCLTYRPKDTVAFACKRR